MGLFDHDPNLQTSFLELTYELASEKEVQSANLFQILSERSTLLLVSRVFQSSNFLALEKRRVKARNN